MMRHRQLRQSFQSDLNFLHHRCKALKQQWRYSLETHKLLEAWCPSRSSRKEESERLITTSIHDWPSSQLLVNGNKAAAISGALKELIQSGRQGEGRLSPPPVDSSTRKPKPEGPFTQRQVSLTAVKYFVVSVSKNCRFNEKNAVTV